MESIQVKNLDFDYITIEKSLSQDIFNEILNKQIDKITDDELVELFDKHYNGYYTSNIKGYVEDKYGFFPFRERLFENIEDDEVDVEDLCGRMLGIVDSKNQESYLEDMLESDDEEERILAQKIKNDEANDEEWDIFYEINNDETLLMETWHHALYPMAANIVYDYIMNMVIPSGDEDFTPYTMELDFDGKTLSDIVFYTYGDYFEKDKSAKFMWSPNMEGHIELEYEYGL